ncbi:LysR family transcriptional regulator [Clostridium cadaveris]|uniref:DNA-binding transcriptional regulator, LysR family n=1 Tax=Clostridium cadaveris TaxID=1529 RepID=A0A1I2K170_9CLOT|nr:LysR family transcriptional regulator [Clostridium cadaveris]MDM8310446.1 LysR family transcriptional regulator [Clostridium cadaveris]MDY4950755.1 LysR family transcriptional regulator [Clostridium cadaveris]NME64609.1 LysR family transcriptional regulator [Clostridium cadaveris]NWK10707.1 LysR family transcriptional regulator [Clostridium cadaveris]PWL54689.1 MAG: LysR family transcriptional regulator [Clostridium cadaveris]
MKIKQLEYLLEVVECGSISKAAQQLFVSQPSLTKSIMGLEEEYGIQILIRNPRGIELTEEGKRFVHYAQGVLTAARSLKSNFNLENREESSRLFIAAQQLDFIYDLIYKTYLDNKMSCIHYNLVETDRNTVTKMVLERKVDLGFLVRSNTDAKTYLWSSNAKRLKLYPLDSAEAYVCIGPKSPYYDCKSLTYEQCEQNLHVALDMEEAASQNLYVDNSNNHFNMKRIIFLNSISACEHFLLQTDALMYVAKWAVGCFKNPQIRAIPVSDSTPHTLELLWIKRAGEPLSQTEKQFVQHLYQQFNLKMPDELLHSDISDTVI